MNSLKDEIQELLLSKLALTELKIIDESAAHAGHAGTSHGGAYLRVFAKGPAFDGKTHLERHRLVNSILEKYINSGTIHALALKLEP